MHMKKYIVLLFCLLPLAAQAQLTAIGASFDTTTTWLTGKPEKVYVFFDNNPVTLQAETTETADFTWTRLNIADKKMDTVFQQSGVLVSSLNNAPEGGYRVFVNHSSIVDTFALWVFVDTFKINNITYVNSCDALRLDMETSPSVLTGYTIYNFDAFLTPPHNRGDSTYRGVKSIKWQATEAIHEGAVDPSETWKSGKYAYTFIDAPPPLKDSKYSVTVVDVFRKTESYTSSETIPAMAAYAIISAEEWNNNKWDPACEQPGTSACDLTDKEALYKIKFYHEKSLNANMFYWKGFGNALQNRENLVMWSDSTADLSQEIFPRVPFKEEILDGYTPGKYNVRLTVVNTVSGCADSSEIAGIDVSPSKFSNEAIPNAFTPNGDGYNDVFLFVTGKEPVSMEFIKVYIFTRSGALVYRYEGRVDAWEGWNGKHMGTGSDVADGVYFYVINGEGWDDVKYDTAEYKGVVHIFR
jgi:gliding motility-associated-like protein